MLGLFLAAAFPLFMFPNRYSPLAFLALPFLMLLVALSGRRQRSPLDLSLLLLLASVLLSAVLALDPGLGRTKLAGVLLGVGVLELILSLPPTERNLGRVGWGLLAAGGTIALAGMVGTGWVTYKFGVPAAVYALLPRLPQVLPGTASDGFHPNEVGGMLSLFTPLALALLLQSADRRLKVAAYLAFLLCTGVLVLTLSRSALLATTFASLLVLAARFRWLRYVTLAVGILAAGWAVSQGAEGLRQSLVAFDQASSYSGSINFASRQEIWQRALYVVRDFPLSGIGLGTFPALTLGRYPYFLAEFELGFAHAHNYFLETAVDFGLGGLIALFLLLATWGLMLWRSWRAAENELPRAMALGLGGGMIAYLLFGLTDAVNWGAKPGVFVWAYWGAGSLVWAATGRTPLGNGLLSSTGRIVSIRRAVVIGVLIVLLAALLPWNSLRSRVDNNLGSRELGRLVLARGGSEALPVENRLAAAENYLRAAVRHDPANVAAQRNLASVHTERGDQAAAVAPLEQAFDREPGNLLARYELARAYSALGDTGRSLPLYRSLRDRFPDNGVLQTAWLDDYVLDHLGSGVTQLEAGDSLAAVEGFRRVLEERPGDLLATGYLARALSAAGREGEASGVRADWHHFSLGTDARVYEAYLADLLPDLVGQGFLASGELDRIASFLLWQHIDGPAATVLDLLAEARPREKNTWFGRAELHARLGDRAAARADLERVLALDSGDVEARFRLGKLRDADEPAAALDAYEEALAISPGHLSALHAGASLLRREGRMEEAGDLRGRLASLLSVERAVASRLGVAETGLRLTPVPLPNSAFGADRSQPRGWHWQTWMDNQDYASAFYHGGVEPDSGPAGEPSLRLSGLWIEQKEGKLRAGAGFRTSSVLLEGDSLYVVSYAFQLANWQTGNPALMLVVAEPGDERYDELMDWLPNTQGSWRQRIFVVANRQPQAVSVRPVLTIWGVGDVRYANLQVSKVLPGPGVQWPAAGLVEIK